MRIKIGRSPTLIEEEFKKINGRCVTHTATHKDVLALAKAMEAQLNALNILKNYRSGATATGMSGGTVSSSYGYARRLNRFKIERGFSCWFLVDVEITKTWGDASTDVLTISQKQCDMALEQCRKKFVVAVVEAPKPSEF